MSSLMLADRIVGRSFATTLAALAASRGADDSALGIALVGTDLRVLEAKDSPCGMLGPARDDLVGSGPTTRRA